MTAIIIHGRFPARPRSVEPEPPNPIEIAAAKFDEAHQEWADNPCSAALLNRMWAMANLITLRDAKPHGQAMREAQDDAERERAVVVGCGAYRGRPHSAIRDLEDEVKAERERWGAFDGGAA